MSVTIEISGDNLEIHVRGLHKLWAFKGSLSIPLAHISAVDHAPEIKISEMGWKMAGSRIPGLIRAGTFKGKDGLAFWDVHDQSKAIKVDLHDEDYAYLVLEVDDPNAAIASLRHAIPT
jgi:hypothetical protein